MIYIIREEATIAVSERGTHLKPAWSDQIQIKEPFYKDTQRIVLQTIRTQYSPIWKSSIQYIYNEHILISNFQKAMRRKNIDACLVTALQLLGQNAGIFLRRLAVVLLEDSLLHESLYSEIVWLMLAVSKGYVLTVADVQLIVDAIITALETEYRYDLLKEHNNNLQIDRLSANWVAIHMRAAAGGMKFDTAFLRRLADRVADLRVDTNYYSVDNFAFEFNPSEHMLLEGVDFHCCPWLFDMFEGMDKQDVKDAIWWHWSSINARNCESDEQFQREEHERKRTAPTWTQCRLAVEQFAYKQIRLLEHGRIKVTPIQTLDKWFMKTSQNV